VLNKVVIALTRFFISYWKENQSKPTILQTNTYSLYTKLDFLYQYPYPLAGRMVKMKKVSKKVPIKKT